MKARRQLVARVRGTKTKYKGYGSHVVPVWLVVSHKRFERSPLQRDSWQKVVFCVPLDERHFISDQECRIVRSVRAFVTREDARNYRQALQRDKRISSAVIVSADLTARLSKKQVFEL